MDGRFIADKFPEWFKILGQSRVDGFELPSTTTDEHSVMSEMQMSFSNGGLGHDRHGQSRDSSEQRTERSMIRKPAWLSARRDDWNERRTPQGSPVRANNDKTLTEATQQSPSLLDSVSQNVNNENSTTGHVTGQKSRESSHTSVSRASAKIAKEILTYRDRQNRSIP